MHTHSMPWGVPGEQLRIAKQIGLLIDNLNKSYNSLSEKQAEYLAMDANEDK